MHQQMGQQSFAESGRRERMLFFSAGGHHHHMALYEIGADAADPPRKSVGGMHFAVTVEEEAEIGRLHRLVTEAGYEVILITDHIANRSFYVKDPDGNVVEITYDVPKAEWAGQADNPFAEDRPYEIPGE